MGPQPGSLSTIDANAMLAAIEEFNKLGRKKFLAKYEFSRSSKFYLMHGQRIYDTKALVGAAYRHATGKKLANDSFAGGPQTKAVFRRLSQDKRFRDSVVFEDSLGELTNLAGEFDRLPHPQDDLRESGFSKWILLWQCKQPHTKRLPGVYVIAVSPSQPKKHGHH